MSLSTRNLDQWPSAERFRKLCQSLAVLAACQNDIERYTFAKDQRPGVDLASMWNGQGDETEVMFAPQGVIFRGFAHESPMAGDPPWPGTLKGLPPELKPYRESFLDDEEMSFCVWNLTAKGVWERGLLEPFDDPDEQDPDGSAFIMDYFPLTAEEYARLEGEYYGKTFDLATVAKIYAHEPLTPEMITTLNDRKLDDFAERLLARSGYPKV